MHVIREERQRIVGCDPLTNREELAPPPLPFAHALHGGGVPPGAVSEEVAARCAGDVGEAGGERADRGVGALLRDGALVGAKTGGKGRLLATRGGEVLG